MNENRLRQAAFLGCLTLIVMTFVIYISLVIMGKGDIGLTVLAYVTPAIGSLGVYSKVTKSKQVIEEKLVEQTAVVKDTVAAVVDKKADELANGKLATAITNTLRTELPPVLRDELTQTLVILTKGPKDGKG